MCGFWAFLTGLTAVIFWPLVPAVALTGLVAWAVSEESEPRKIRGTMITKSELRPDVEKLTSSLPQPVREKLCEAVSARLEAEARKILGEKEGTIQIGRTEKDLIARIYEDGRQGCHEIKWPLP